ncbi:MAG TPA: glycolate oxidase subunit GlcE [Paucimonas sp.]|nr:glycolate oxidase subunit GlcE [Paucimonas sp.]
MEHVLQQFKQRIVEAGVSKTPLRLRGGGTKDWYGQALDGEILDTREYRGIVAYDPTELVITARCGTPLAEIEAVLAERNQVLAFEPPRYGADSTIGGAVASGLSGPRRQAAGAVRDFVLGATLMDGKGEVLRFGGRVMKNVAGYDVARVLAGSLGILGLMLEVSLKVLPRPFFETTLRFDGIGKTAAIERLNQWGGEPLPISASAWHGRVLIVRLSGAPAAVEAAAARLGGERVDDAPALWNGLRDQTNDFFAATSEPAALWRLSLPSATPPLRIAGEQLFEWGGAQRWLRTEADAATLREAARKVGGHATLFRGGDKGVGVFQPLAPAAAAIHRRLKNVFDPAGIFNRGRMYPDI